MEIRDEFDKAANNFLSKMGFSDDEISNCFTNVKEDEIKRENLINELTKNGFEINLILEDFPVKWYEVFYNDKKVVMNHDISRSLTFMDTNHGQRASFDPSVPNVIDAIKDYIDKIETDISMDKKI